MANIEWIIFSKCRTLQLKSCISSLVTLSDVIPQDITVLYSDSKSISYKPIKKEFSCRFIRQTDFYQNLMDILRNTPKSFISFIVDDLIVRDYFSSAQIEGLMHRHKDLDCFSLRLGKNIKDGKTPEFEELEPDILSWKTARGLGTSWNYFWEISSSIYRKEHMLDYLQKCSGKVISFPNPLESHYYGIMPNLAVGSRGALGILRRPRYLLWSLFYPERMTKRMSCYKKSRAFTQGINMVAGRKCDYKTYITPEKLHELFLQGYKIDFKCLKDVHNERPNAGPKYLRIVGPGGRVYSPPTP